VVPLLPLLSKHHIVHLTGLLDGGSLPCNTLPDVNVHLHKDHALLFKVNLAFSVCLF